MTEILQKNYFRRVAQLVCRLLACMKPWVQSQARCKPRVMVQQKQEDQELQSQFVASLGYIRKDSKSHRETSLFIFTFASSASQNNKQKTLQLKTQRSLTIAFKCLVKTWHGSMLAKLMLEKEAPSSPQNRFQLE